MGSVSKEKKLKKINCAVFIKSDSLVSVQGVCLLELCSDNDLVQGICLLELCSDSDLVQVVCLLELCSDNDLVHGYLGETTRNKFLTKQYLD